MISKAYTFRETSNIDFDYDGSYYQPIFIDKSA